LREDPVTEKPPKKRNQELVKIIRLLLRFETPVHKLAGFVFGQSEPLIERKLRHGGRLG
jgi:hypothetical protein